MQWKSYRQRVVTTQHVRSSSSATTKSGKRLVWENPHFSMTTLFCAQPRVLRECNHPSFISMGTKGLETDSWHALEHFSSMSGQLVGHRLQSHAQQLLRAILSDSGVCSLLPSSLAKIPCIEGSTALITLEAWQHVPTHAVHASFGR